MRLFVMLMFVFMCHIADGQIDAKVPGSDKEGYIRIEVKFRNMMDIPQDLSAFYSSKILYSNNIKDRDLLSQKFLRVNDSTFRLSLTHISAYGYLAIVTTNPADQEVKKVLPLYFVENGDNVVVSIYNKISDGVVDSMTITGAGAPKYMARYRSDLLASRDTGTDNNLRISIALAEIKKYKQHVTPFSYEVLQSDVIGYYGINTESMNSEILEAINRNEPLDTAYFHQSVTYESQLSNQAKIVSMNYALFRLQKLRNQYKYEHQLKSMVDTSFFNDGLLSFKNEFLKEKMIVELFKVWNAKLSNSAVLFSKTLSVLKNNDFREKVMEFSVRNPGQPAFDFSLPDGQGNVHRLNELRGKTVFMDFWYTGCENCAAFYQGELSKIEAHFRNDSSVVFITVCIDRSKEQWAKSVKSGVYTSPEALNLYTAGEGASNSIIKHYNITSYPQPILIDKNGRIYNMTSSELRRSENTIPLIISSQNARDAK